MSKAVIEKAQRLLATGCVTEAHGVSRVFPVAGDHGTYAVLFFEDGTVTCTCPATSTCAHIAAALLQIREETIAAHTAQLVD